MKSISIGDKNVTYEDSTHEYHIDGVKVPSVTQVIIGGCFHRKPSKPKTGFEPIRDMSSLRRGSKIHEELQDHIAGVASSEKAKAIMGMICTARPELYNNPSVVFYSEAIVIGRHRDYQYAGMIDLAAKLNDEITVFEIKSGKNVAISNANHIAQVTQYGKMMKAKRAYLLYVDVPKIFEVTVDNYSAIFEKKLIRLMEKEGT